MRIDGDKTLWKVQIPSVNPLNASSHDPLIAITDALVAVVYDEQGLSVPHITAFALEDGHRLWDTKVGKDSSVLEGLASNGKWITLAQWGALNLYDPATGALKVVIGEAP